MKSKRHLSLAALTARLVASFSALLGMSLAAAAIPSTVPGEAAKPSAFEAKRSTWAAWQSTSDATAAIDFAVPLSSESAALYAANRVASAPSVNGKRIQVGYHRAAALAVGTLQSAGWTWQKLADGRQVARLTVASPGAAALRVGFMAPEWPTGVELRAQGNASGDVLNQAPTPMVLAGNTRPDEVVWSPALPGDVQVIEWVFPAGVSPTLQLSGVSHLVAHPLDSAVPKLDRDIGSSGSCNFNVTCVENPSLALQNAIAAVAKMVFTDSGSSFRCTGTLLNDTDPNTQTPWFITGNHCFENSVSDGNGNALPNTRLKTAAEMEVVSRTLNTYWSFQSTTCGGSTSPATQLRAGGSTFITNNDGYDMLFLRLLETPPSTAFYSGWITDPVAGNLAVTAIHHPGGDLKKISTGAVTANPYRSINIPSSLRRESYIEARWTSGVTEGGSSGSGLFNRQTLNGGDGYFFRGTLWGGASSCAARSEPDFYSRFDLYSGQLASFLAPGFPQTGWWWNSAEDGRGFFIERRGNNIFMAGYYYETDGRATWFTANGAQSGNNYSAQMLAQMLAVRNGQTLNGAYREPDPPTVIGNVSIDFTSATTATMRWPGGTTALTRFGFGGSGAGVPENGWWWNSSEGGRGFSIEIQGNTLFMVGFMYDDGGNPIWYLSRGSLSSTTTYQSVWELAANGQSLTGSYRRPIILNSNVGGIVINWVSTRTANLTLPNGRVLPLTRFDF
jgi:lysyl endopeptidase